MADENNAVEGEVLDEHPGGALMMMGTGGAVQQLEAAQIDMQITTAKRYPRSITRFSQGVLSMVKNSKALAEKCIYRKPQAGGHVTGPSIRFAELIAQAWGNMRISSSIVEVGEDRVVARGVALDLQTNIAESVEVPMSIRGKKGRYSEDMIDTICKAAQAKARRDVILATIPRGHWLEALDAAQAVAKGDVATLEQDRKVAFKYARDKYEVDKDRVLGALGIESEKDLDVEKLELFRGLLNAIYEGELTVDKAFPPKAGGGGAKVSAAVADAAQKAAVAAGAADQGKPVNEGEKRPAAEEPPAKKK